jgi:hypothetical protein
VSEPVKPNWYGGKLCPTGQLVLNKDDLKLDQVNSIIRLTATATDEIGAVWDVSYPQAMWEMSRPIKLPPELHGVYCVSSNEVGHRHILANSVDEAFDIYLERCVWRPVKRADLKVEYVSQVKPNQKFHNGVLMTNNGFF